MADARVRIIPDISLYAEAMRKIPGMTDAAAIKAAMALEARLSKAQERAGASAAKAAMTAAEGAKKATGELADSLAGVNKVSQIFGGILGPLGGALDDSGDLMEKFGMQTAGYAVAAGAAVAAAALVAKGLHDIYSAGSEAIATWDDLTAAAGGASETTAAYEADVRAAAAAQQAADRAAAHLSLVLGGELAPAVERVNELQSAMYLGAETAVVGIGLMADAGAAVVGVLASMEREIETTVALMGPLGTGAVIVYEGLKGLVGIGAEYNEQLAEEARLMREAAHAAEVEANRIGVLQDVLAQSLGMPSQVPVAEDKDAQRAAEKAHQEAQQRADEAARLAEQRAQKAQQATEQLIGITDSALASQMNAYDRIVDAQNRELEKITELERVSGAHMEADLARMAVTSKAVAEQVALRDTAAKAFVASVDQERAALAAKHAEEAQGGQQGLRDIITQATYAQLDAEGQILAQRDLQIAQIAEFERVSGEHALAEQARALTMLDYEKQLGDARSEAARAAAEGANAARVAQLSSAASVSQAVSQTTGMMLNLFSKQGDGAKEAARIAYGINQAAALTNIAIYTAEAVAKAAGAPPLIAVALLTGAAAAASVAATPPPFHTGRFAQPSLLSDEQTATLRRGEVVVPAPTVMAAGGPERIRERVERSSSEVMTTIRLDFTDRAVVQPLTKTIERARNVPRLGWS